VIDAACPWHAWTRSAATDRDDYLAHPEKGEELSRSDASALRVLCRQRQHVQFVVSDGLNANAINEHARTLLPAVRQGLAQLPCAVGGTDVVIQNGRVRAGYHVGELIDPLIVVHVIGERPGTGLNTASAYLTYGRDSAGQPRWSRGLDHACTTAICGIHPSGTSPAAAAEAIVRTVARMLEQRASGVALGGRRTG
jgi:ethanolamine ammonia-lyase small subunit